MIQTKYIEFIGPSGIGKTTFLKNLKELRTNDSDWISNPEIHQKDFRSSLIGKIITGYRLFVKKNSGRKKTIEYLREYEEDLSLIISLLYERLNSYDSDYWKKVRLHDYVIHDVMRNIIRYSELGYSKIVLDEGLIHNSGIYTAIQQLQKYSKLTDSMFFPVAVVAFKLEKDEYKKRILKRFEENNNRKINSLNYDLTDNEVNKYVHNSLKKSDEKVKACKLIGLPVLEIEPVINKINLNRVNQFILNSDN